jgi:hypothetical protein
MYLFFTRGFLLKVKSESFLEVNIEMPQRQEKEKQYN